MFGLPWHFKMLSSISPVSGFDNVNQLPACKIIFSNIILIIYAVFIILIVEINGPCPANEPLSVVSGAS